MRRLAGLPRLAALAILALVAACKFPPPTRRRARRRGCVPPSQLDLDLTPGPAGAPILIDTSSFDVGMGQTIIAHPDPLIGNIAVPAELVTQSELPEILVLSASPGARS